MKLHYYPETDSLYTDLANRPSTESREVAQGPVVDFDVDGNIVGIDIDHASKKLDLKRQQWGRCSRSSHFGHLLRM